MSNESEIGKEQGNVPGIFDASQNKVQVNQIAKDSSGAVIEVPSGISGNSIEVLENAENNINGKNTESSKDLSEKYRLITLNTSDLIAFTTFDVEPIFTFVSPSHKKILGYEADDLLGKSGLDFIHEDDKQNILTILLAYIDAKINDVLTADLMKNSQKLDFRFRDKSGQWHFLHSTVDIVNDEILFVSKDVTEQKRIEEQLRYSNELFSKAFRSSPELISITSLKEGRYVDVNDSFLSNTGYNRDEVIGHTATELNIWIDPSGQARFIQDLNEHGSIHNFELRIKKKSGEEGILLMSAEILTINNEPCVLTVSTNITDRKRVEETLRENEQKMRAIVQGLSIAAFVVNNDHRVIYWNKALEELSNIHAEEIIGTTNQWKAFYNQKRPCMADILVDGGLDEIEKWYAGRYKKSSLLDESFEATDFFPNLGSDGKWLRFNATVIRNTSEELIGVLETLEDISERKKAEIALQESEKQYRLIFDYASDGIILLDLTGKIIDVNDMTAQIFGGSKEEIIGKHFKDLNILSLRDLPQLLKNFALIIAGRSTALNITIKNRKGEQKYLETSSSSIIQNGKKIGILAIVRDNTKRKQMGEALQESEERFRLAISSITDILYEWDLKTGIIQWFGDIDSRLGYEEGKFSNTLETFLKHIHPEDVENVQTVATDGLKSHKKWEGEYRVITKHGTELYWCGTGIGVYDQDGKPFKVVGAVTDITKRKIAEEELQIKNRAISSSFNAIAISDLNGKLIYVNDAFSCMWGYTDKDALNINVADLNSNKNEIIHIINDIKEKGFSQGESIAIRKDGSLFNIQYSASLVTNTYGKPIAMLSTFLDITERKHADDTLRRSEEKYRLVTENASDAIWTMDLNLRFTYVSPSNENLTGYTSEKLMKLSLDEILTKESMERCMQIFTAEMQLENNKNKDFSRSITLELNEIRADGTIFPIEVRVSFLRDTHHNPIGILGITRDISERKKQEDALKKSEEKFIKAFRSSPVAIAITRVSDGKFLEVNESLEKLIGYNRDELLAQTTIGLGIWADINDRKPLFEELAKTGSVYDREYRFRSKRGDVIFTRFSAEIIDFSGEECVISVLTDITNYKKANELLRESEEKYRNIVENTKDVIMLTLPDGRISYISPASVDVLEYTPQDLVGKIPEIYYPDDIKKVHTALSSALQGTSGSNLEYRILTKNGKMKWVSHSWSPIQTENHELKYVVSVVRDVTESKISEQILKEKIEELEKYKNVTVNREVKMVDLKNEINILCKQLNQKPKYPNI